MFASLFVRISIDVELGVAVERVLYGWLPVLATVVASMVAPFVSPKDQMFFRR